MAVNTISDEALIASIKEGLENTEAWITSPEAYVVTLDKFREPLLELRCRLQKELFNERERMRLPNYKPEKGDNLRVTDFDRKIQLDSYTSELNEKYELVRGLEELVKERVALIKTLLETK